ncbi:hypothetical protein LTS18_008341 [Coniosporium uncinatum]|uniref:Uncharacterized protein n=1 Tax=Coniosporium uncinatum TaxID=93489 RepID=A0ACC3DNG8_9PEZI|nr:hypothetical protein LTS18_008341 [Coniosporium uncinatum]
MATEKAAAGETNALANSRRLQPKEDYALPKIGHAALMLASTVFPQEFQRMILTRICTDSNPLRLNILNPSTHTPP